MKQYVIFKKAAICLYLGYAGEKYNIHTHTHICTFLRFNYFGKYKNYIIIYKYIYI